MPSARARRRLSSELLGEPGGQHVNHPAANEQARLDGVAAAGAGLGVEDHAVAAQGGTACRNGPDDGGLAGFEFLLDAHALGGAQYMWAQWPRIPAS